VTTKNVIKRIAIIEPAHSRNQVFGLTNMELIGPILIGTVLRNSGYDVRVFREETVMDWPWIYKADIVGISFITPLATRAYEIGDELKSRGIPVVMGGIHPTLCTEESLEHCDFVVRHEGEDAISELLDCLKRGGEGIDKILGISYKNGGKIYHNNDRPFIEDLDAYPMPDFSLVSEIKKKSFLGKMLFCPMKPVFTSRGCTYNCTFCSVRVMFGGKYRAKSTARVIDEIKDMIRFGSSFFFVDDNLGVDRGRLKELCQAIINERLSITWNAQVRADLSQDQEVLKLMSEAGCTRVHIGFESADDVSLKAMGKRQSAGAAKVAVRAFHEAGIKVHAMFILGFDNDSVATFGKTLEFWKDIEADTGHCAPLTMFPGTQDYSRNAMGEHGHV